MNMKKLALIAVLSGFVLAASAFAQEFVLKSPDVSGQLTENQVFSGFGCQGKNISPALEWANAPKDTKSFAVTVYDPDAPTGAGWWHWVIFNIPAGVHELKADAGNLKAGLAPQGSIQSITSYGAAGYGGACPPPGDKPHRYIFTVFALDVPALELNANSPPAMVGFNLNQHVIARASIMAYYGR
jgi:Raf kinase inhibitor-like YbhB/YbcL family protein